MVNDWHNLIDRFGTKKSPMMLLIELFSGGRGFLNFLCGKVCSSPLSSVVLSIFPFQRCCLSSIKIRCTFDFFGQS